MEHVKANNEDQPMNNNFGRRRNPEDINLDRQPTRPDTDHDPSPPLTRSRSRITRNANAR